MQEGVAKWQPPTASNPRDCVGKEAVSSGRLLGAVLSCHTLAANLCLAFPLWKASREVARIPRFLLVLSCQALCSGEDWKTCLLCWAVVCSEKLMRRKFIFPGLLSLFAMWTCTVSVRSAWSWCWGPLFACKIPTSLQGGQLSDGDLVFFISVRCR